MKKILLGLMVLSFTAIAADETKLYFKTGLDISREFKNDYIRGDVSNRGVDGEGGFEFAIEGTREFYPNLELGLGIALQDHGKPDKVSLSYNQTFQIIKNTGYKSLPVYAIVKYNIPLESSIKPYLKADLGYAYNFGEEDAREILDGPIAKTSVDNGVYYGLGAGIEYNNFLFEIMHKVNKADISYSFNDGDHLKGKYDYSRTTLSVGYRFDI